MNKTCKKVMNLILDFLVDSGDKRDTEKSIIRIKRAEQEITTSKVEKKSKEGSLKGLIIGYVIFSLPFVFMLIQHYYKVKRGDLDAGIALLFMACGIYVFFTSFISKLMHNLIPIIIKIHKVVVLFFGIYGFVILVTVVIDMIDNSIHSQMVVSLVMFIVMLVILTFTSRQLKKEIIDIKTKS